MTMLLQTYLMLIKQNSEAHFTGEMVWCTRGHYKPISLNIV